MSVSDLLEISAAVLPVSVISSRSSSCRRIRSFEFSVCGELLLILILILILFVLLLLVISSVCGVKGSRYVSSESTESGGVKAEIRESRIGSRSELSELKRKEEDERRK